MRDNLPRRRFLQYGISGVCLTTAGCERVETTDSEATDPLKIVVFNFDTHRHNIVIDIFQDDDKQDQSNSQILHKNIELPPKTQNDDFTQKEFSTIDNGKEYLVRVTVDNLAQSHYHYRPDCQESKEHPDKLGIRIRPSSGSPAILFSQTICK